MDPFRYEHRHGKLASPRVFFLRLGRNLGLALILIGVSLAAGMAGYMAFEGKSWIEAYDYAAMILSGMGPFEEARTDAGRLFEGTYALYSGLMLIAVASLILAPVFHRVLHSFHVDDGDGDGDGREKRSGAKRH